MAVCRSEDRQMLFSVTGIGALAIQLQQGTKRETPGSGQ